MATYSSCPWVRILVLMLQAGGNLVYSWPRPQTPFEPRFSLPLCLWAIFINMYSVCTINICFTVDYYNLSTTTNLGSYLYNLSFMYAVTTIPFMFSLLLMRGKDLFEVFTGLDELAKSEHQNNLTRINKTKLLKLFITYFSVGVACALKFRAVKLYWVQNAMMSTLILISLHKIVVVLGLFQDVFEKLGHAVHQATQRATASTTAASQGVVDQNSHSITTHCSLITTTDQDKLTNDHILASLTQLEFDIGQVSYC